MLYIGKKPPTVSILFPYCFNGFIVEYWKYIVVALQTIYFQYCTVKPLNQYWNNGGLFLAVAISWLKVHYSLKLRCLSIEQVASMILDPVDMGSLSSRTDTLFTLAFPGRSSLYYIISSKMLTNYIRDHIDFCLVRCPAPIFIHSASFWIMQFQRGAFSLAHGDVSINFSSISLLLPYFWGSIEEICTIGFQDSGGIVYDHGRSSRCFWYE